MASHVLMAILREARMNFCNVVGLICDDNDEDDCFCKPCVQAFEVDVYQHIDGEEDDHLVEYYGDALPGCEKMSICGTIHQGERITLRIYDNMQRDDVEVKVVAHAGDEKKVLTVTNIPGTCAYQFTVTDKHIQVSSHRHHVRWRAN